MQRADGPLPAGGRTPAHCAAAETPLRLLLFCRRALRMYETEPMYPHSVLMGAMPRRLSNCASLNLPAPPGNSGLRRPGELGSQGGGTRTTFSQLIPPQIKPLNQPPGRRMGISRPRVPQDTFCRNAHTVPGLIGRRANAVNQPLISGIFGPLPLLTRHTDFPLAHRKNSLHR